MNAIRSRTAVAILALALAACSSAPKRHPDYAAVRPAPLPEIQANPGAIYQHGHAIALYEDYRAHRIGDILTVRLIEATNASKEAVTKTKKDNQVDLENPTLFGSAVQSRAPRALPLASNRDGSLNSARILIEGENEFTGEGSSTQKNSLTGSVTVTVAEVLANGNLVVRGEKLLSLNQGDEHIRISGIVRPRDILSDNSVLSTQLADVTIQYGGSGVTDDANRQGWLSRFFNSGWWPF